VTALVLGVLVASLLGSAHCAGMCGGFVCLYATASGARRVLAHAAYHGGRLVSYTLLGALAGALGAGLDHAFAARGLASAAATAAGAFVTLWGAAKLVRALAPKFAARFPALTPGAGSAAGRVLASLLGRLAQAPSAIRALALGLLTTLMPCAWLYAFVASAAGTGSAAAGALVMAAFWAGTLPVMALLGALAQTAAGPFARRLPVVSAVLLVAVGLLTLSGRLSPGRAAHLHAGPAKVPTEQHACH